MMRTCDGDGSNELFRLVWPLTVREAWVQASSYLSNSGVEDGAHHAELLLRHVLNWDRAAYLLYLTDSLPEEAAASFEDAISRRSQGEPTQYVMGEAYFYGRRFEVSKDVLIPRPETELLVEAVLEEAGRLWASDAPVIAADVGTGSGAIVCTLALERPHWNMIGVDISPDALRMAQHNAEALGTASSIEWLEGDLLLPLKGRRLDILVSNPPYIPDEDMSGLQREVRDFEPHLALVGGRDGLDPYRRMMDMMKGWSELPSMIAFELGQGQAGDVVRLIEEHGHWTSVRIVKDLAGIERHVLGIKSIKRDER